VGHIFTVKMPEIGEGVIEGEVIQWLKQVNDNVKIDEPIVVVMTDKATVELPSPYAGQLTKQHVQPGENAIRGKPLYDIQTAGEDSAPPNRAEEAEPSPPSPRRAVCKPEQPAANTQEPLVQNKTGNHALASPGLRKLAKDLGIDIERVKGTGKEGLITVEDIKGYLGSQPPKVSQILHLANDEEIPIVGIRNLMAKKMKESKTQIPHFSYFEQVEATRLIQLRRNITAEAAKEGIHLTYMPFFIKALSLTIQRYPIVNSMIDASANKLIVHKYHNVGIAFSTALGLIVPVLKNVEQMPLIEIIRNYDALKQKAYHDKLQPADMKESTITISNFGVLGGGGLWATPIINYPEAAILAVARIQKQPVVKNQEVKICDVLNLSWSFDHRVIDGDSAASISHYFSTLIQNPAALL
jgi:pyruvate dehydrogenase E2 component (dihydrolipoamide acetyltransferase)